MSRDADDLDRLAVQLFNGIPAGAKFGAILADPGIAFATRSPKGETSRVPQKHYRCSSFEELARLPVAEIAAKDAFLFVWIPLRSIDLVYPIMGAWGFKFSGSAFVWAKTYGWGGSFCMGGGYGTRHNAEVCWLGRRGSPQRLSKGVRELIVAPRREHSRKPDEVYRRIEALCAGPFLEIFARQQWPGWTCVGDESERFAP
jgi:N6-adenosine-specific RNA methylase IME4